MVGADDVTINELRGNVDTATSLRSDFWRQFCQHTKEVAPAREHHEERAT